MDSDNDNGAVGTLLFMEAKRASVSTSDIQEVEYQAFTAACAYYAETGQEHIWTMTCVGSMARLWVFNRSSDYLIPYIPTGAGLAEKSEYIEIFTHSQDIVDALNFIKEHLTPPRELLDMPPSPRPAHRTLPMNWHDNEVVQLDMQHQRSGGWALASTGGMGFEPNPDYYSTAGPQRDEWAAEGDVWDMEEGPLDTEQPPFTNPQGRQGGYY